MKQIYNERLRASVYYGKHDSGLDIYVLPKGEDKKYRGVFTAHYGSNDTDFIPVGGSKGITTPHGTAHFLQHEIANKYNRDIEHAFGENGSPINSNTGHTFTVYSFLSDSRVKENIELLFRNTYYPDFAENSIQEEKEIITKEINMIHANAKKNLFSNLLKSMYINYPVKEEIQGDKESISRINEELLHECHSNFYHPSNSMFFLVGDVNPEEIFEMVDRTVESYTLRSASKMAKKIHPHEPPDLNSSYSEMNQNITQPLFAIGFKDVDTGYNKNFLMEKELETSIVLEALFGENSGFLKILRERNLIDHSFMFQYEGEKDYGYSIISGQSREPFALYNLVKDYIINGKGTPREGEIEAAKRKICKRFFEKLNSPEYFAESFPAYYVKGINLLSYTDVCSGIGYNSIYKRVHNHLSDKNMALSVILPS